MDAVADALPRAGRTLFARFRHVDWLLLAALLLLAGAGLLTMNSFTGENPFFERQVVWIALGVAAFLLLSLVDFRFLRRTWVIVTLFLGTIGALGLLLALGAEVKGAQSWFHVGSFAFQPSDPAKIVLILLLAKYFSRRHVEIAHVRHILVSGFYAFVILALVFLQPDFGSAIIIGTIWLGMVLVSGISKRHLLAVFLLAALTAVGLWFYGFEDYQRQRIVTFLHPYTDLSGAGYNAFQSTIAAGSGGLFGKGVGYGTQSKLRFLPEYETDFIFAAFAEEWGFVGVLMLFGLYGVVFARVLSTALRGETNFEILYGAGLAILLASHIAIHVGMNAGLLPVTGTTIPFMSYGGSHILTEFSALGILMGMRRYARPAHRETAAQEFIGV